MPGQCFRTLSLLAIALSAVAQAPKPITGGTIDKTSRDIINKNFNNGVWKNADGSVSIGSTLPTGTQIIPTVGTLGPSFYDSFSTRSGALANGWVTAVPGGWTISGGLASNSPILGAELLTDPGLEGTYTTGLNVNLTKNGSPTVSQSADVHGGSAAQAFTATAFNDRLNYPTVSAASGAQWYRFAVWGKRTAGTGIGTAYPEVFGSNVGPNSNTITGPLYDQSSYTLSEMYVRNSGGGTLFAYPAYDTASSAWDSVIVDDGSLKAVNLASMFAMQSGWSPDSTVRTVVNIKTGLAGLVARADSATNPQNFIVAYLYRRNQYIDVVLEKCVAGTWTTVSYVSGQANGIFTGSSNTVLQYPFEIRMVGSQVSVWWNGSQVIAPQTISDAGIMNNRLHGMFAGGNSTFSAFAVIPNASQVQYSVEYGGSSITTLVDDLHYQGISRSWLMSTYPQYQFSFGNQAQSGKNTFNNLVRWWTEGHLQNPNLFIFDSANDDGGTVSQRASEALIRLVRTYHPQAKIVWMNFFSVANATGTDPTATNQTAIDKWKALVSAYNLTTVDYQAAVVAGLPAVVAGGGNLSYWFADTIHPNTTNGQPLAESLLQTALTSAFLTYQQYPGSLPSRLYDDGSFERPATNLFGTQYTSQTGTWTTSGTTFTSSVANSTVTYTCTCMAWTITTTGGGSGNGVFGTDYNAQVSIDGGSYSVPSTMNGLLIDTTQNVHTVTFKVTSGTMSIVNFYAL